MIRLEMKNCNMILIEQQQKYQHNHLEKLNIRKYEYLTGKEILLSDQGKIIKQAKFAYSVCKVSGKQIKTIEYQGEKQIKVLEEHGKKLVKYSDKNETLIHIKTKITY